MSTAQGNLRGVLATLRNAGVFDSIQGGNYGITTVTTGDWTIQYWVAADDGVKWFATNAAGAKAIRGEYTAGDYKTLLLEILNSVTGHFPAGEMVETPAREVLAGDMGKSYIGRTVTIPWIFRDHEATITGALESVKHDEFHTYFELENTGNYSQEYVYRCASDSTVTIHDTEESDQ